ncbi:PAS domain S-box protein [Microcoleus sp. FACHB-1515]|uniref:PAS domain S-box protein n=1 Tax=Cyanophyceae TaxID=3028117 RepID=UPI001684ECA6|nr:PAS domain S-box protein [Microcoleus sp. FACHB-1515]MBD2091296.1 PAS domain S-box protein [Microcoleus sp. FACHB-1515]
MQSLDPESITSELLAANAALEIEIAERKQIEAQLNETQRRLELSLKGANLGTWTYRVGTDEFWADDRALQLHGHAPGETNTFAEAGANIHPEDYDRGQAAFATAIQTRSNLQIEYRVVWRDRSVHWVASYAEFVPGDRPDEGVFYGVAQDITAAKRDQRERLQTETALRETETRLRVMIQHLPGGAAFVVDRNLRYLLAEGEALSIAGFKPEDLVGKTVSEAMPSELVARYEAVYRSGLAGETFEFEHDAHDRFYISRGTPLRSENNEIYAVLAVSYDITERKQAEIALRESEERLRLAIEAAQMYAWEFDLRTNTPKFSENAEQVIGRSPADSFEENLEHVHPDDRATVQQAFEDALTNGDRFQYEMRSFTQDNQLQWFLVIGSLIRDAENQPIRAIGISQNITDRKSAEAALYESEAKYRSLFESIDEGYLLCEVIFDENEKPIDILYLEANPAAIRLAGRDFSGRRMREIDPNYEDYWYELIGHVALTGESVRAEHYAEPHGRWFDFYASRVGGSESRRVASIFQDTTDRKRVEDDRKRQEAALRDSEERLRDVLNSMAEGFALLGSDFTILDVNEETLRLDGRSRDELIGRSHWDAFPGSEDLPIGQIFKRVVREHTSASLEHEYRWPDGRSLWLDMRAYPTRDAGVAIFWRDVTDRKQAEAALRESEERLQKAISIETVGVLFFTLDGRITDANDTFLRMSGYSRDELRNIRDWHDLTPPEFRDVTSCAAEELATLGKTAPYEKQHIRQDGSRWWGLFSPTCLKGSGRNAECVEFVIDISDRKRIEDDRNRREEQQQYLLRLSDALRPLSDAAEIEETACRLLGESLGVNRAYYVELNEAEGYGKVEQQYLREGASSLAGTYELSAFSWTLPCLRRDETIVVSNIHQTDLIPPTDVPTMEAVEQVAIILVPVVKGGELMGTLAVSEIEPRIWKDAEIELAHETLERMWAAAQRARAERALRESETKYRSLFTSMDEGYFLCEVIFDENHQPVDLFYIDENPAAIRMTGQSFRGRRLREIDPNYEEYWYEIFGRVAQTGQAERLERYAEPDQIWYDFYVFKVGSDDTRRVAVVFSDITDRKHAEAQLRRAAQVDAFRVKLSDALRSLTDPMQIQAEACRLLGEQLGVDRAFYVEIYEVEGYARVNQHYSRGDSPSIVGDYPLAEYGWSMQMMRRGETIVVADTQSSNLVPDAERAAMAMLQMVGFVALPLIKGEVLVGALTLNEPTPREWTEVEVELVRETAERIWADIQRAHAETALRESEEKYRTLFDSIDEGLAIVEMIYDDQGEIVDIIYRQVNRAYERQGGVYDVVGRSIFDVIPGVEDYWLDLYKRVAKMGESVREENYQQDVDRWFDVYFSRIDDTGRFVAIVFSDISDRKRREMLLRENEARQAFLLKLSDILQQFVQPNDIKAAAMRLLGEHLGVSRAQYHECDRSGEYYSADGVGYANGLPLLDLKYRIDDFGTFVNENFAAGRPYRIDDLEVDPQVSAAEREAYRTYQIRAGAGVPLIRGGKLVAILAIHDAHPHAWTDLEMDLIRETAERIWTPLERARVEEALRESEEALAADLANEELLRELAVRLIIEENVTTIYDEILSATIAIARADAGTIQIYDLQTKSLELIASKNFSRTITDYFYQVDASSRTACGIALNTGQRAFVDFPDEVADFGCQLLINEGIQAALALPLVSRTGTPLGMLNAHWRETRYRPSDRELRFLDLLARQVADLIEQRQAEAALRESEAKYRSLFTTMDQGFCFIEKVETAIDEPSDFRYLAVNPAFERHTEMHNVVGKTIREFVPDVEQRVMDIYDQVVRTGQPQQFEEYISALDQWIAAEVFPAEQPNQIAVLFSNISDRKRAEIQLRRAADMDAFRVKLSDALRSLTDPVEIQAIAARLLGEHLNANQVHYGETIGDYVVIQQGYGNGLPPMIGSFRFIDFGERLIADYRAGRTAVSRDVLNDPTITEAERRTIAGAGFQAYIAVPLTKEEGWVATLAVHSIAPRDWTTDEVELVKETAERTWAAVERARAEAALRESELQRVREQSAREQERQRAEALAELDRAKTTFFSNISHEFRTPLTLSLAPLQDALKSVDEWMSGRVDENPSTHQPINPATLKHNLELVHRNNLRLLKLVNTLLDFSRIEAGRMEAVYEPTDLAQFTIELASVFRSAIERAGLQLIVDCPSLPEPVYVDREMWEKIVLNLLSNAFKFTFEGEIRVSLHSIDRNQAILQIQDTGTGIAPEHLPHLFERFYQVRGTQARTHEGSGIGLALVNELVRLQGGTIEVRSTPGEGTCFTVSLLLGTDHLPSDRLHLEGDRSPVRTLASTAMGATTYVEEAERWLPTQNNQDQTIESTEEQTTQTADSSLPNHRSARVLVADDNADIREYLTRILSEHVQVEAVADGVTALAVAQERVPDLILSDVMMPGLDGFELLQALRADSRTREVPIILLSARAGEEAIVEGLEAGADDYLAKPFSAQELVSRVTAHLQTAQQRGEALQEARSTLRSRDEFISVVSHELNTPLVSILGWTRLLRSSPPNPTMLSKALDTIERNATLQAKLVQDLLDLSRISAGKLRLNPQPIELQPVIETAIATVAQTATDKGIHLTWQKNGTESVVVMGDGDRLSQVFINLLTNAIKFTPESGSVMVELSVMNHDGSADASYAEIRVIDTGIGIAADFLPHVFERFRQAEGAHSVKGLGLGLAIARHIVELHNGTIHADSAGEEQGATFTVRLPLLPSRDGFSRV